MARNAWPFDWKQSFHRAGIRVAHPTRLDADAHLARSRRLQCLLCQLQPARADRLHCTIGRRGFHHLPSITLNRSSRVWLSLTFGKVFHPWALHNCREGQSLDRKRQNAVPNVYARDSEAERERCIERDRETRQFFIRGISEEQRRRSLPTKLGLCSTRACRRLVSSVSRIYSRSPPTLRAINSRTVDFRFALRTGSQRMATIPSFGACMTAIRTETHNRGSLSYRQQWWAFQILTYPPA